MSIKSYLKRAGRYIIKGVPNVNITAKIYQLESGKSLMGKSILITGGGRGIGYNIAKKCISEGANVLIAGRNEDNLKKVQLELGTNCYYIGFDILNINEIDIFMENAIKKLGKIDCLVNNAGISLHEENILNVSEQNYDMQFDTNLKAAYFLAKSFIKHHVSDEDAGILFISSERGKQCDDVPYGLTKSSLNSLTKGLSRRFYKSGIRVNAIAPGITASEMTGKDSKENMFMEAQAAGRFFLPEEVAELPAFILSDASKCISGEVIACDAGQYINAYWR